MGHGVGTELKSYRVEWRPDLTAGWIRMGEHDSHDEALASMQAQHQEWQGQVRVITQHVIEIKGLGS